MAKERQKPPAPRAKKEKPLAPCPCGKVPSVLVVDVLPGGKYGTVTGNCCGEWSVEFRNGFEQNQDAVMEKGKQGWNDASRG